MHRIKVHICHWSKRIIWMQYRTGFIPARKEYYFHYKLVDILKGIFHTKNLSICNITVLRNRTSGSTFRQQIYLNKSKSLQIFNNWWSQVNEIKRVVYLLRYIEVGSYRIIFFLNRGQSSVKVSYSPPSPHTLRPYWLFWKRNHVKHIQMWQNIRLRIWDNKSS